MQNVVQLRSKRAACHKTAHPADDLSFMKRRKPRGTGIDYWNVEATGQYGLDHTKGEELAREYLAYISEHRTVGNATLLGLIVRDMAVKHVDGQLSGLEIGFLRGINEAALLTAVYAPQAVS